MSKLNEDFLIELLRLGLMDVNVMHTLRTHMKYNFIPGEAYKNLYKFSFDHFDANNNTPTIGILSQAFGENKDELALIGRLRQAYVADQRESLIGTFEDFIRNSRLVSLFQETQELYNSGSKERAIAVLAEKAADINEFSLGNEVHARVFRDFDDRQKRRREEGVVAKKIPTGIPAFDYHTKGGIERGTALLIMARSGVGKSYALRSLGFNAAIRGINVAHFQTDATKNEILDYYDGMWTGVEVHEIKKGNLGGADEGKIDKAKQKWLEMAGEIFVISFEQFGEASMADCREKIIELMKQYDIGLAIFDYIDEFDPGDGIRYGASQDQVKQRKKAVGKKVVNIATELNIACAAATQSNDIAPKEWNDPNFVITRHNITADKETVFPFAYFLTLNQTQDEFDKKILRIYEDKMRHYYIPISDRVYHVAQDPARGRFIDTKRTYQYYWDDERKKIIKSAAEQAKTKDPITRGK